MTQHTSDELDAMDILVLLRDLQREPARPDTFATLTRLVVAAEAGLYGAHVHSLAELGLRAQALGLLLGFDELDTVMRQAGDRGQYLYSAAFRGLNDSFNRVFHGLPHVHRRLRVAQESPGSSAYDDGVRAAQDAMASIGADADLRCFLQDGSRSEDERVRLVSTQLQEFLALRFPVVSHGDRVQDRPRSRPTPTFQPHA